MPANGQTTESRADEVLPAFWAQLGLSPPSSPAPRPAAGLTALQSARFGPLGASVLSASQPRGLHRRMVVASDVVVGGWRLPYLPHLRAHATSRAVGADVADRHLRSQTQSVLNRLASAVGSIDEYAVVNQLELAGREADRVQREGSGGSAEGGQGGSSAACGGGEERERARRQLDAAAERVALLMLAHLRLERAVQQQELVAAANTQGQGQESEAGGYGAGGGTPVRALCALRCQHRHRAAACVCCDALLRHLRLPVLLLPEMDLVAGMAAEAQDYLCGKWPIGQDPNSCSCTPADKARALARALADLCGCGGTRSSCKAAAAGAGGGQRSRSAVAGDGRGASSGQDGSSGGEGTAGPFCSCWFYSLRSMHLLVTSLARGG